MEVFRTGRSLGTDTTLAGVDLADEEESGRFLAGLLQGPEHRPLHVCGEGGKELTTPVPSRRPTLDLVAAVAHCGSNEQKTSTAASRAFVDRSFN
jgi:hypothetical protein